VLRRLWLSQRVVKEKNMKIAAVSDDGTTISQHFGRAMFYVVSTVEDGKVANREKRPKAGHRTFAAQEQHAEGEHHGFDAASQAKHRSMADTIADCQVLLAGGMGWGAYESLKSYNIQPIVTDVENIDEAVQLHLAVKLPNLMERLH
jgi:predicted Fe-Mo cluster-binding NifX family protein